MPPTRFSPWRSVVLLGSTLVVVACGGGPVAPAIGSVTATSTLVTATPKPSHPVSPKPSVSPRPTLTAPPPSPTPVPSVSAIAALKIGSPYRLVPNPANTTLHAEFTFQMGAVKATETMTGREIHQRTKLVGLAYVLEFDGIPLNAAVFEGGARGAAANVGGTLTYSKILGHRVALISAKAGGFGMYILDDVIVMVGATSPSVTKTLLTSVIRANG
jgi:hypothetical protein